MPPFEKYLRPLNDEENKLLTELASKPLATFNESDVREEYLASIVELLGYHRGGNYDVQRGKPENLSPPFLMLGVTKIIPDYKFSIWKQGFWLLEAKSAQCSDPNDPPQPNDESIGQAFSYTLHPQVDTPYFAVSNGWWFLLFERDSADPIKPILTIAQPELPGKFDDLRKIIGAEQITFVLKNRLMQRTRKVLSADCSPERTKEFVEEINRVVSDVKPIVFQNFRDISLIEREKHANDWQSILNEVPTQALASYLEIPRTLGEAQELSKAIISRLSNDDRDQLFFSSMLLGEARPVRTDYYFSVLYLLAELALLYPEEVAPCYPPQSLRENGVNKVSYLDLFIYWADLLLHHLKARPELRMLCSLEMTYGRIAKRFFVYDASRRRQLLRHVELERFIIPESELSFSIPAPAKNVLLIVESFIRTNADSFFREHYKHQNRSWNSTLANQYYNQLCMHEKILADQTPDYPDLLSSLGVEWHEFPSFDIRNTVFDYLAAGTCAVLESFPKLLKLLPDALHKQIQYLASLKALQAEKCCEILGLEVQHLNKEQQKLELEKIFDPTYLEL